MMIMLTASEVKVRKVMHQMLLNTDTVGHKRFREGEGGEQVRKKREKENLSLDDEVEE